MITIKMKRALSGMRVWQIVTLIFMLSFIAVAPPLAQAAIPRYINYQGKLTDANDDPVTGDVSITIRIYNADSGGTALWTETQTTTVTRGIFSILLGNSEALDSLDFNSPYWYSVEVESDGEMTPRQRLTSVGYAINADKLDGYDASDFLAAAPSGALSLTGGANENVEINPTGTGDVVITIDSTSGDFRITDGTTNFVLVDNDTGNVSIAKDLTVAQNLTVTGNIALDGSITDSSGAVTIADALTQTGSSNQVTFEGNVDASNGLDVTGALTVSGATTLSSALDMNSNIDLDYSGASVALDVTQGSTGAAAQFSGGRVIIGENETTNTNALSTGELYVLGDLEVDGTIYGNVSSGGTTALGDTTLASLTVTGASDLQGNISNSTGAFTVADNTSIAYTDSSTTGAKTAAIVQPTYQDSGVNSDTVAVGLNVAPVINYTGAVKSGSYTALKIAATETSLPVGANYLINATAGADATSQKFYVDNSGNAMFAGTVTASLSPSAPSDLANKAYVDSITPATAGGWTDGGTGVYLLTDTDNVGVGTSATDTYKLNISGSTNTTSLYIGGTQVTSTADELNKLDGYTGTAANLNTLTDASNADALHIHAASSLTGNVVSSIDGVTNDGGDIDFVEGANMTITPNDTANTITFASSASGDEVSTTSLTFTIDSDNGALGVANGAGIVLEGGTGTDASIKFNSATNNIDIAGVTGGLNIPDAANYKINGTQIASANLSDSSNLPKLDTAATITGNWVNTTFPWADNEVANDITASNYLPLAGGTMTGDITLSGAGTNIVTTGIDLDLSPASGYGMTSTVTRSADTGDEVGYNLAATINKLTSGNYTGVKLNVTETSAPGAADKLLDLQVGDTSKFTVDNAGLVTTASINSASVVNDSITAADLNVNVISSIDGVTNDGGDIDLIAGSYMTIMPDDGANTITISADLSDSGFVTTAPSSAQTIQPTADVVPLTIKGMAGASSNVLSIYDAAAVPSEKIYVDNAGRMRIAETTTGGAQASAATMYFGRNATDNWETIGYDPTLGTKGLFTFSAPLQVEASSPTGITFVEKNAQGAITKSQGFMYDPAADEFSFTGGKMKQAFQNLVRGGSFESWNTPGWYSAWYGGAYTTTMYAKHGTKSLYIYDSSDTQTAYKAYYISNWDRLKGSNVTLSVWAKCDSGTTTASIGIGTNISSIDATVVNNIALTTTWQNFSFTYAVPSDATTLKVYLYGSAGSNGVPSPSAVSSSAAYYDGVTLAEGKLALEYGPSPVFDTGDQVIGGSLAIGADIDPYNTAYGMNYYQYPRIVFGEPDAHFGGFDTAYSYGGYNYTTYGGGAGEISFRPLNTSSGTFTFNRPIGMDSYEMSNSSWRTPALFIGRLYDYSGGSAVDKPDYAWTTSDAYIKGVVEADGGLYGDVLSFYGGVGKTSNLLTYSEDFAQSGSWSKAPAGLQVTAGELAPDGTSTACKLISTVDAAVTQTVSATNSTMYTFSVYLAPGAQNYAYIFLKSNVETEWWTWPNYQYVDLYNTTGWRRFSVTYTTPSSGTTSVTARIMFYGSSSYNSIKVWGAQLRPAASQGIYLKTTSSSIINSNSLFHGDGSGLTNLAASSIASGTADITGISGTTFTINEDLTDAPSENLSIAFNRGNVADSTIAWDETNDKFVINNPVNISSGALTVAGAIVAGSGANQITTSSGLLDATKLYGAIPVGNLPSDGYASTYVNVTGDTMTGTLNLTTLAATTGNDLNLKLGDAAGANKLAIQTSTGTEKFSVLSDGTVKIDGGYTATAGGGITLQPNGDIYFDGNMYQTGNVYTVDTVRFTGNYDVGVIAKFGVGATGIDADYLQIDADGYISDADDPVTINDALLQTGSANQVTFQGNVDALNGLDVTGNITATGTVDGIDISSDSWVTSGKIADGAVATADLTDSAVTAAKIGVGAVEKSKILELRPYATTPTADNKVNVAAGIISVANNAKINFAGAISPAFDPVTADSRIDLLTIDSTGALVIVPGTQAGTPTPPTYPTDKLAIAEVTVTETAVQGVSISASDILDVRPFLNLSSGSGNSSITTTDSVIFTIGTNTDETANNVSLAFGNTAGGQKSIIYQGASSDDFVFNDDISLGANSLKFTTNTLTDTKVGNYDSHLLNTSNPHSVTAAQIGGTGIVSEINAVGTSGAINASRLAAEVLTQTEGDTRYLTPVKTVFTAEYPNAIMYGDGIGNSGTMAVKNTGDANWRNYYEWSSQNTVLQDYTVSVRYELPQDFAGWALANAIKLGYITQTALDTDNKVDVTIYKAGSAGAITTTTANVSASWSEIVIDDSVLGAWSAGDILIIEMKVYSKNSNFTRVGDITLNYTR